MTPAGTSNELDVRNKWKENTHNTKSVAQVIGIEPTEKEVVAAVRETKKEYTTVPLVLPVEFLELGLHINKNAIQETHRVNTVECCCYSSLCDTQKKKPGELQ